MKHTNLELFKFSKAVYREAMLHSQMEAAGSNKAKFLERLEKNKSSIIAQSIIMKILVATYIVIFAAAPIASFMQINIASLNPFVEDTWNLFVGGLSVGGFMLIQPILLIIFTVTFTWGFLSKEPYTWMRTLPFSNKDAGKITFFTFFRGIDIQLIVLTLVLPIGTMIGINFPKEFGASLGTNFLMFFVCFIINLANTIINISIVILTGRRMTKVMEGEEANDRLGNFIRIFTIVVYLIFSMLASYTIQTVINYLPVLFDPANQFMTTQTTNIVNIVLSFIPFPFAGGFLLTSIAMGFSKVPILVIIGSIIGLVAQMGLAVFLFRKALRTLQRISRDEVKIKEKIEKETVIEVRVSKPTIAFLKRDLVVISREVQPLIFMILPIMIPITTAVAYALDTNLEALNLHSKTLYILLLAIFSMLFLIIGLTSLESGGETITSSLPIKTRNQIKAKLPFLFSIVPLMEFVAVLIHIRKEYFLDVLVQTAVLLPALFLIALTGFYLKVFLFGKLKYKIVIDEVNTRFKFLKIVLVILVMFGLGVGFLFTFIVGWWLTLTIAGVGLVINFLLFNLMFPKNKSKLKNLA